MVVPSSHCMLFLIRVRICPKPILLKIVSKTRLYCMYTVLLLDEARLLYCQYLVMDSHTGSVFSLNKHMKVIVAKNFFITNSCRVSNGLQSCSVFISREEDGKELDVFLKLLDWLLKIRGNKI